VTLIKLNLTGKYKEFTKITLAFLISNIALISFFTVDLITDITKGVIWIRVSFYIIYLSLLGIGHWLFSYEYYNMVRIIPFVLDGLSLPEEISKSNRIQFWIGITLNSFISVVYGIAYYFCYLFWIEGNQEKVSKALKYYKSLSLGSNIVQLISAFYLGLSILRIKKLIEKKEL
jgi:hypothetical protein